MAAEERAAPARATPASAKPAIAFSAFALVAILGLFTAAFLLHPDLRQGDVSLTLLGVTLPTVCWFRLVTGLPCAGCGLTRAVVLLVHGYPAVSFAVHPFGSAAVALALLQVPPRFATVLRSHRSWIASWDRLWTLTLASTAALMLVWWASHTGIGTLLRAWTG